MTFVYVTHDQEEALTMSDRIAVFNHGRIEQVGTPAEVYDRPATEFVAGFVGISNIVERDGRRSRSVPSGSGSRPRRRRAGDDRRRRLRRRVHALPRRDSTGRAARRSSSRTARRASARGSAGRRVRLAWTTGRYFRDQARRREGTDQEALVGVRRGRRRAAAFPAAGSSRRAGCDAGRAGEGR